MTVHLACLIARCEWPADPAASSGDQYRALVAHYRSHHFQRKSVTVTELSQTVPNRQIGQGWDGGNGHPGATSPSVVAALQAELDKYVKIALEWPQPEGGPFDSMPIKILENELEKAKATSVGRGIAIALCYMRGPQHHNPTDLINEAVARYREGQAPTHLQEQLGAQQVQEELAAGAQRADAHVQQIIEQAQQRPTATYDGQPFPPPGVVGMEQVGPSEAPVGESPFPTPPSPAAPPSPVPSAAPVSSPAPGAPVMAPPAPATMAPPPPAPPVQPVPVPPTVEMPQAPAAPMPAAPVVQLPTAAPQPVQQATVAAPPVQAVPEWGSTGPTSSPPPVATEAAASFAAAMATGHQQVQVEQPGPPPMAPPAFAETTTLAVEPELEQQLRDGTANVAAAAPDPELEQRNDRIREALAAGMTPQGLSQMMGIPVAEIEALR